jgi:hypothetical protein
VVVFVVVQVTYQLPRTLPSSSESITHEILFQFDVKGALLCLR